jgi:lipopolysaccharide transport system permease protein
MRDSIKIYESDNSIKFGYSGLFREILEEIYQNRWLTYQLFRRDFFALYKQSLMGVFWAIVVPVISVATFLLLSQSGIFNIGDISVPYALYAILGMSIWQIFATGLLACSNSLVNAGSMITKINFSKKSLVIASTGQALISFSIQFGLFLILCIYFQFVPNIAIILIPLLIIPIYFLSLGLGFLFSLVNGVIRDVGNLVSFLLTFLMLLTPILYVKPMEGVLLVITEFNPLFYLTTVPRDLILFGKISEFKGFIFSTFFSIAVFIVCLLVFHLTETRVTERI